VSDLSKVVVSISQIISGAAVWSGCHRPQTVQYWLFSIEYSNIRIICILWYSNANWTRILFFYLNIRLIEYSIAALLVGVLHSLMVASSDCDVVNFVARHGVYYRRVLSPIIVGIVCSAADVLVCDCLPLPI